MPDHFDIAVIGAGIAGASVAAALATAGKQVALFEREAQPGYHTTGRSAAIYSPTYGPAPIRALTRASGSFFAAPPDGFNDHPLIAPRDVIMIARPDQDAALQHHLSEVGDAVTLLDPAAARARVPFLKEGYAKAAVLDTGGSDIDVAALHQGYLKQFRAEGGALLTRAEVLALSHAGKWQITLPKAEITADTIVNAAGAWADAVGQLAGAEPIGLTPKRRTAITVAGPAGGLPPDMPLSVDIQEHFYVKPEGAHLLLSPADETPSPPCDAQPEEMDIAICIDRVQTAFDLDVQRIESKWAGLRSFVPDKSPVAGFSATAPAFYWLAGQGGYGIQSAPALADWAAAEVLGRPAPGYILDAGLNPDHISPSRLEKN